MKQIAILSFLILLLAAGCGSDDDDGFFNRIAQIGRLDGWIINEVISDYGAKVNDAIDALTDEEIAADPRSREELRMQYAALIRTATVVDDCDRDDVLFFLDNGLMRIILGDDACGTEGDPNPLARFHDRTYSVNIDATEMSVRANTGVFLGLYELDELNSGVFSFETEASVADSIFTNLTYNIRYELIPN